MEKVQQEFLSAMTEAPEGSCEGVVGGTSPIPQHIGEASAEATTLLLIEQRCVVMVKPVVAKRELPAISKVRNL
ncbi:MAG: hypothetical protein ACP5JH_03305 [Bacteroidota bacterium]